MSTRRSFLRRLAAGTAGLTALPLGDVAAASAGRAPAPPLPPRPATADEAFWRLVRAQFPLDAGITPMNAANLCPAPRNVIDAVLEAGRDVDGDVSFQNRAKYDELREQVRGRLASYLGVEADEIAIVRNTSEANNAVVAGIPLGPGDEVVLFDENHPSNLVAWDVRGARQGFAVRRVRVDPGAEPAAMLAAFEAAMGPRTRVVAFSDVSNRTGVRLPTADLCALARQRGVHAHVDGAQTFGALAVDLRAMGCDSYTGSAHKWLVGPKEAGLLYVRRDRVAELWPLVVGVGWGDDVETRAAGARRFETLGQRDDAVFAGLAAALDLHTAIGPERVEARVLELAAALKAALGRLSGARPVTSADPRTSAGIVVTTFDGVDGRSLFERLYAEHGIAGAPTGGLRLAPHIYNTREDVERAAAAVAELLRS